MPLASLTITSFAQIGPKYFQDGAELQGLNFNKWACNLLQYLLCRFKKVNYTALKIVLFLSNMTFNFTSVFFLQGQKVGSKVAESMHTNLLIRVQYDHYSSFFKPSELEPKNWPILELFLSLPLLKFKIAHFGDFWKSYYFWAFWFFYSRSIA